MQNALTIPGHAPAVRASRALTRFDVRKAYTRAIAFLRRKAVTDAAKNPRLNFAVPEFIRNFAVHNNPGCVSGRVATVSPESPMTGIFNALTGIHTRATAYGCHIRKTFFRPAADSLGFLCNGYGSRSISASNAQNSQSMQTSIQLAGQPIPALRALTRFDVRKAYTRAIAFLRRKAVTLAAISTAALYAGILIGSYPIICTASLAALGFVALADSAPKGGEA